VSSPSVSSSLSLHDALPIWVPGGTHTITAREVNGCGSVTSSPFRLIGYPRFFTPNGDGYNDTWNVVNDESLTISKVIIFDRYGRSEEHTSELQSRENLVCRL